MDVIFIRGLELAAVIGVYDFEQEAPQRLIIDLELAFETRTAGASDDVADTLDYQKISSEIEHFVSATHFSLVETLANRLAEKLLTEHAVSELTLTLTKPDVLLPDVGVRITRSREKTSA